MKTLTFKTTVDNTGLKAGLKQMEAETVKASSKIASETKRVGEHMGSLVRPVGDVLDAITGQRGYVMKLQALTHGLGFGLAAATGGLVAAGLAAKLYQSADAADTLNKKIGALKDSGMPANLSTVSGLHQRLGEAQGLKEEALGANGMNLGLQELQNPKIYTKPMMFMKQLKNAALDIGEVIFNPSGDKFSGTNSDKNKRDAEEAQKIQQESATAIGRKIEDQIKVKKLGRVMDDEGAALKKNELDTDEKIGDLMRTGLQYRVDMQKAAEATLELSKLDAEEIKKKYQYQRLIKENQNSSTASSGRAMQVTSGTVQARQNEFTKYFNTAQESNFLKRRIKDAQGYMKGTMQGPEGDERRAELQGQISRDQGRLRDLGIRHELMTPDQRRQEKRDDLREKHAIDRADRKSMQGMTPEERKTFKAEKDAAMSASSKTSKTFIDDGSITKLTNAITTAVGKLILK